MTDLWLARTFMGYRVITVEPTMIRPRWYDIPRWLRLRPWRFDYLLPPGEVYLDKTHKVMYVRTDDMPKYFEAVAGDGS